MFSRLSIRNLKMTTKHQVFREGMRNWLPGVSNNNYKAFCKVCRHKFSVKQNSKEKVKQHEKSAKHQKAMNESKSQAALGSSQTGSITVSKSLLQDQMNLPQLIAKSEIIQGLHVVETNQSFLSTDKDSERFREQFPDSKIAAGYFQCMLMKHNISLNMELHRLLKISLFMMRKTTVLRKNLMK